MGKYDEIIDLPYTKSKKRPHMPISERAAQFSSFQALSGYGDSIDETGRETDKMYSLDDDMIAHIDEVISLLSKKENAVVNITYFVKDKKKDGGKYFTATKEVKRIDDIYSKIIFKDRDEIEFKNIYEIEIID